MSCPLLPRGQNAITQLARPHLLTDACHRGRLLVRMLMRMMILRANGVCYRVETRRRNALALELMVKLKALRLLMEIRRQRFRLVSDNHRLLLMLLLLLVLFLLDECGEIVVALAKRCDVCRRHMLELVHVNHYKIEKVFSLEEDNGMTMKMIYLICPYGRKLYRRLRICTASLPTSDEDGKSKFFGC